MQGETGKGRTVFQQVCFALATGHLLGAAVPARAASISLPPVADTSLIAGFPDNNLGANSNLVAGVNGSGFPGRALLRFDPAASIPPNAVILSASLTVTVVIVPGGGGVDSNFDLRRVLTSWGEGSGTGNSGAPAEPGEATWNSHAHPDLTWSTPGGTISNDFSGAVSATTLLGGPGRYVFASSPGLVADLQNWLARPTANFGWVLLSEAENTSFTARRIGAQEDSAARPLLQVQYVVPGTVEIHRLSGTSNGLQLRIDVAPGQSNSVQYSETLQPAHWALLTNLPPVMTRTNVTVEDLWTGNQNRFYRLMAY